jgi:hypothetical protein
MWKFGKSLGEMCSKMKRLWVKWVVKWFNQYSLGEMGVSLGEIGVSLGEMKSIHFTQEIFDSYWVGLRSSPRTHPIE